MRQKISVDSGGGGGRHIPRAPVFGWSYLYRRNVRANPSLMSLPNRVFTTSGRSALYQALRLLGAPVGSVVLVPTYHCPTMVAPVVEAGYRAEFYEINGKGLPDLSNSPQGRVSAIIVSHYFGLPQSLAGVRSWCDQNGVALIEDCAHSFVGYAGERHVGAWGEFSTGSITKFLPVPEAGILASSSVTLDGVKLLPQGALAQIKGIVALIDGAVGNERLYGFNALFRALFRFGSWAKGVFIKDSASASPHFRKPEAVGGDACAMLKSCDLTRIHCAPLWVSQLLFRGLPFSVMADRRCLNFQLYADGFSDLPGASYPEGLPRAGVAPYVYPLLVQDADRVFSQLRTMGVPVLRWDRVWPGTPENETDTGLLWRNHLLQFLCHQDLSVEDIMYIVSSTRSVLLNDSVFARA